MSIQIILGIQYTVSYIHINKYSRIKVDFLRRHVSDLKRGVTKTVNAVSTVANLQKTVSDLQTSLAQALYRTEQLENKTRVLEESKQHSSYSDSFDEHNVYYSSRAPKTTYYYMEGGW